MPQTPPAQSTNGHTTPAATPTRRRTTPQVGQNPEPEPSPAAAADPPAADLHLGDRNAEILNLAETTNQQTPDLAAAAPAAGERVVVDAAWLAWAERELAQSVDCEALYVEIGIPEPEPASETGESAAPGDPFDAELLLVGSAPSGREVAVWIRLTPTVIADLQTRLDDVLTAQRHALGVHDPAPAAGHPGAANDDEEKPSGSRVRRIADPLGVRSMVQTSTTRAHIVIVAAVVALVLLAVILRITS